MTGLATQVSGKVRLVLASAISAGLATFPIFSKRFSEAGSVRVHSELKQGRARQVHKEVPISQLTFKCRLRIQFLERKLVFKSHVMNAVNIVREPVLNPALT
jgi:hypothetical protein